jgi:hypothetical protein
MDVDDGGKEHSYDNPLILANRKAKRLASTARTRARLAANIAKLPELLQRASIRQ